MNGSIALDTSVVIRFLNGNQDIVDHVLQFSSIILPVTVVGELIYGAENSGKKLKNLTKYFQFIDACVVLPMGRKTAEIYAQTRLKLKQKGKPIPENDIWIAAQCIENNWILATCDSDFTYVDGLSIEQW
ncbi:type II toxin-antitoxin system VapC family toxin [Planktothrix agardhii 1806]|uniref:type II toxin-antitoxin system VapC family toxin n=1 Tax=Planktothrix agardhii TaxID=1160 RepID=UPI001F253BFF|nr:type II toxin-antitoxin system VapC family toxin [Planktothrix agardhii]MCF3569056.1 type II toxin-antitoxin system VapC family toxin [Planktothrix agardhii 1807]MCF3572702.1 type II toxin-antitoxin system VapC family toxin [Planktothrix agardhii 1805]MCF3587353.1 type II toxin-antitoxin system VapC family toxin [Planktothrix agardhii 1803]MCF3600895.1 type II toxin-antitoxin system VapC family toxin [Planktothrix agardhii 1804]MCF3618197.1 type II toxin-antitoxin system VapC family toxin [